MLARMGTNRNSHSVLKGMQSDRDTLSGNWLEVSFKLNIILSYDLAIKRLGIYSKELKTYVHPKAFKPMLRVHKFIVAKN